MNGIEFDSISLGFVFMLKLDIELKCFFILGDIILLMYVRIVELLVIYFK